MFCADNTQFASNKLTYKSFKYTYQQKCAKSTYSCTISASKTPNKTRRQHVKQAAGSKQHNTRATDE